MQKRVVFDTNIERGFASDQPVLIVQSVSLRYRSGIAIEIGIGIEIETIRKKSDSDPDFDFDFDFDFERAGNATPQEFDSSAKISRPQDSTWNDSKIR